MNQYAFSELGSRFFTCKNNGCQFLLSVYVSKYVSEDLKLRKNIFSETFFELFYKFSLPSYCEIKKKIRMGNMQFYMDKKKYI